MFAELCCRQLAPSKKRGKHWQRVVLQGRTWQSGLSRSSSAGANKLTRHLLCWQFSIHHPSRVLVPQLSLDHQSTTMRATPMRDLESGFGVAVNHPKGYDYNDEHVDIVSQAHVAIRLGTVCAWWIVYATYLPIGALVSAVALAC